MPRQKLDIDAEQVYKLASYGANNVVIAGFFGCTEFTIRTRFHECLAKARAEQLIHLHTKQFEAADAGNVTMLIWLGKQYLGQSDKIETKNEHRTLVDHDEQDAMLTTEETLEIACNLDEAIIRSRRLAITADASRDDPGRLRPSRQ